MDAIQQLENELSVLDAPPKKAAPVSQKKPVSPPMAREGLDENAGKKLKAAETLAEALDNLSEYVEQARAAAHGLVAAFSLSDPTGHPLTVGETAEEPTTSKEPDDDEVPQTS